MKALLVASIAVPDDAMRELALTRGVAVRDYLSTQQLPLERLFLGAPKLDVKDKGLDAARSAESVCTMKKAMRNPFVISHFLACL